MLRRFLPLALALLVPVAPVLSKTRKPATPASTYTCTGYICIDADTGKVLAEQSADSQSPPASVTKLMTFLVILDDFKAGKIKPADIVTTDRDAYRFLGTKAYLSIGEKHTYDQMLYALMVQSANDGAIAVAKQDAGTVEAFVARMNARAATLGMLHTSYTSPHGYPPGRSGRGPDLTTARDLSKLSREILLNKDALKYTSTKTYHFRDGPASSTYLDNFTNHNKLLGVVPGCDGLKTGWSGDGASIVTTASRGNKRVIAVVLGGKVPSAEGAPVAATSQSETRNLAARLMEQGLTALGVAGAPPTGAKVTSNGTAPAKDEDESAPASVPASVPANGAPESVPASVPATRSNSLPKIVAFP